MNFLKKLEYYFSTLTNTKSDVFNFVVAQLAHFAWGALFVDVALHFQLPWFSITPAWAASKEYVWDTYMEHATQVDNTIDFAFYIAGMLVRRFLLG